MLNSKSIGVGQYLHWENKRFPYYSYFGKFFEKSNLNVKIYAVDMDFSDSFASDV